MKRLAGRRASVPLQRSTAAGAAMNRRIALAGVSTTMAVNAANLGLGIVSGVITARALEPSGRGVFVALVVWATTLATISTLGIPGSIIFHARGDTRLAFAHARRLAQSATRLLVPVTGAMLVLGLYLGESVPTAPSALLAASLIPLSSIAQFAITPLLAGERLHAWNVLRLLPSATYVGVSLVLALTGRFTVVTGLAALVAGNVVTSAAAVLVARRVGASEADSTPAPDLARWARRATVSGLPALFRSRIDQLVLAAVAAPASLGVYAVAVSVAAVADVVVVTIDQLAFPRFVSRPAWRARARRLAVVSALAVAVLLLPLALASATLISWVYGSAYRGAADPLLALLVAAALRAGVAFLMAEGRALNMLARVSAGQIIGLATAATLTPILYHAFGITGPALAVLAGETACLLYLWFGLGRARRTAEEADEPETVLHQSHEEVG